MQQGWISLHRKITEHPFYQEKRKFSKFEAWIDLLLLANHKDNKVLLGNEIIHVERGSFITSKRKLMERWGWSNTKIETYLNLLVEQGMLLVKSDTKKTVITIVNYDFYQGDGDEKRHETDAKTTRNRTNNNDNNVNNENKNKEYMSQIKNLLSRYVSISDFAKVNKEYWNVIRETRKRGDVAHSVIYNTMKKWERYDPLVVYYAIKTHVEMYAGDAGKREEYTLGIMRRTTVDDATDKLDKLDKKSTVSKEESPTYKPINIDFNKG